MQFIAYFFVGSTGLPADLDINIIIHFPFRMFVPSCIEMPVLKRLLIEGHEFTHIRSKFSSDERSCQNYEIVLSFNFLLAGNKVIFQL